MAELTSLRELWQRFRGIASFSRLLRIDDSGELQVVQLQGFVGEVRDGVPRIGEAGFASHPLPDSQAVVVALGGDRGRLVVLGVEDRRNRPKDLPEGAAELYAPGNSATRVRTNADGTIQIDGATLQINVTGAVDINGTAHNVTGPLTVTGDVTIGGIAFLSHSHPIPPGTDAAGGIAGPPQ